MRGILIGYSTGISASKKKPTINGRLKRVLRYEKNNQLIQNIVRLSNSSPFYQGEPITIII